MKEKSINLVLGTMTMGKQMDLSLSDLVMKTYFASGGNSIDTAFIYADGVTEKFLGKILKNHERKKLFIATKANPKAGGINTPLVPEELFRQLDVSLERLGTNYVDLFYLHSPDNDTEIKRTLEGCGKLYSEGKIKALGLSNYAAWQVAEIYNICEREKWILPSVYQGMYNAVTRDIEKEVIPCLRNFGISFYAYNPLAGGLLTGKYQDYSDIPSEGRFYENANYKPRYWKKSYFEAMKEISIAVRKNEMNMSSVALRWIMHHSKLKSSFGDAVILGASNTEQLSTNINSCKETPLDKNIQGILEYAWDICSADCPDYFRN